MFSGIASAAVPPAYYWQYDAADNSAVALAYGDTKNTQAYLRVGKSKYGKWMYVYFPSEQPKSCVGISDEPELLSSSEGTVVGHVDCDDRRKPFAKMYAIKYTGVNDITKGLTTKNSFTINGERFDTHGFEEAAGQIK